MKKLQPCAAMRSHLPRIFSFSASSISPTRASESALTRAPYILILSVSMGMLPTNTLAFSMRVGWPTPIFLSRMNPCTAPSSFDLGSARVRKCQCATRAAEGAGGVPRQGRTP